VLINTGSFASPHGYANNIKFVGITDLLLHVNIPSFCIQLF